MQMQTWIEFGFIPQKHSQYLANITSCFCCLVTSHVSRSRFHNTRRQEKRKRSSLSGLKKKKKIASLTLFYLMIRVINILYPLLLCAHLCLVWRTSSKSSLCNCRIQYGAHESQVATSKLQEYIQNSSLLLIKRNAVLQSILWASMNIWS